jgi:hypothetical protein
MENNLYDIYSNSICNDIPIETLKDFIMNFLIDASKDMGCDFDKKETPDRIYYIISVHYNHLPLSLIASGFKRGALGQYGGGRLVPKTVFGWMGQINEYYLTKHNTRDNSQDNYTKFDNLHNYPLGAAINKKIDWYMKGGLDISDWDKILLKEVAEMIGKGHQPTLEKFGIKNQLKNK